MISSRAIRRGIYAATFLGILISVYLSVSLITNTPVACPNNGVINCERVITGPFSDILGVPLSVLGLILFVIAPMMVLRNSELARFLWWAAGGGAVLYSLSSQLIIGNVCVFCLSIDVLILLIAVLSYYRVNHGGPARRGGGTMQPGG